MSGTTPSSPLRMKEGSPFTPGIPVPVELFVGRVAEIEKIRRYARQACSGRLENIFLTGERGIGKSSLARYVKQLCLADCNMLGVNVMLGGVSSLDELVRRVFEELLKESSTQRWFEKIRGLFGGFIKQVDMFGVSVEFQPPKDKLEALVRDFPTALKNVAESFGTEFKGLLIVLDDLNGLANNDVFANWYKSMVDYIAVQGWQFPVLFVLCGLPERRDGLARLQPSLMRIFHPIEVGRLQDEEIEYFMSQAFDSAGVRVLDQCSLECNGLAPLETMAFCCSGLPTLMHEIGDAVYWTDNDGIIDGSDAMQGIRKAAEEVGRKYLDPMFYRAIRSPRYRAILDKVAQLGNEFHKQDVENRLETHEKKVFNNFLRKMTQLGVIEIDRDEGRGAYRFVNTLYPLYIRMQSGTAGQFLR